MHSKRLISALAVALVAAIMAPATASAQPVPQDVATIPTPVCSPPLESDPNGLCRTTIYTTAPPDGTVAWLSGDETRPLACTGVEHRYQQESVPGVDIKVEERGTCRFADAVTTGTSATTFSPRATITRAELVTLMWRRAGSPTGPLSTFTDVPAGSWYAQSVAWAAREGITNGVGGSRFAPSRPTPRAELVTMLWHGSAEREVILCTDLSTCTPGDVPINTWYSNPVRWALFEGITSRNPQFHPQRTATRAEAITMLWREADRPEVADWGNFGDVPDGTFYTQAVQWAGTPTVTYLRSTRYLNDDGTPLEGPFPTVVESLTTNVTTGQVLQYLS